MGPDRTDEKMTTETLTGKIETVFGKKLEDLGLAALDYSGDIELFDTKAEVVEKNEMPNDDEIVAFRNTQRRNNKRQALMAAAIEAAAKAWTGKAEDNPFVKPTLATSSDLRYKAIYDALRADKKSHEEADRIAKTALGLA